MVIIATPSVPTSITVLPFALLPILPLSVFLLFCSSKMNQWKGKLLYEKMERNGERESQSMSIPIVKNCDVLQGMAHRTLILAQFPTK